jgi:hypothetical protein
MGVSRLALWATAVVLIATGCGGRSNDAAEPPRNTAPQQPLVTEPRQVLASTIPKPPTTPVAPSTTIQFVPETTTTIPAQSSSIPILESIDGFTAKDISDAMTAALAAENEWNRQKFEGTADQIAFEKFMDPDTARRNAQLIRDTAADNRRYQRGTYNERTVISAEVSRGKKDVLAILVCEKDNGAEYRTQGTPETSDDVLISDDLTVLLLKVFVTKRSGEWKHLGTNESKDSRCDALFP